MTEEETHSPWANENWVWNERSPISELLGSQRTDVLLTTEVSQRCGSRIITARDR